MNPKTHRNLPHKVNKSLNISLRVKKERQISIDNLNLIQRLQSKKSLYSFKDLHSNNSRKRNNNLLSNNDSCYGLQNESFSAQRGIKLTPLSVDLRNTVFKSRINLEGKPFTVEISKGKKQGIKILATNEENGESFSLNLKYLEALELMEDTEN